MAITYHSAHHRAGLLLFRPWSQIQRQWWPFHYINTRKCIIFALFISVLRWSPVESKDAWILSPNGYRRWWQPSSREGRFSISLQGKTPMCLRVHFVLAHQWDPILDSIDFSLPMVTAVSQPAADPLPIASSETCIATPENGIFLGTQYRVSVVYRAPHYSNILCFRQKSR